MRQLIIILVVVALLQLSRVVGFTPDVEVPFNTHTLVSTGFILLAAYAFGELFRALRLPALLGYLAAGVVFGPSLATLVYPGIQAPPLSRPVLEELSLVNMLAVGVIGTMGGGELKIADLKQNFPKLLAITGVTFVLVLPIIGGLIFALSEWAPQLVPFLDGLSAPSRIAAAVLFGVLAVGMSPSATLALLQEVRARGPLTNLVLGTVVFADLVLVALFLLALALAKLLISPAGFSFEAMAAALPQIGSEFGWAILIGIAVGIVFIAYLRLVGREVLLFSLGVIFVTSFIASRLHAETLLAFLIAGFVVQNFSSHGHDLIEAFELIALPVFVIYFTTQAANLDLAAVSAYLPLTILLVTTRCTTYYFGIGFGAKLAHVDEETKRHLRVSFFSQGGVDLVLAALIAEAIPVWGVQLQTVTMATILFYIVAGPPFLARALDTVGESAAARERGEAHLAERRRQPEAPVERVALVAPKTADNVLGHRLSALYLAMDKVLQDFVQDTVATRSRHRSDFLADLAQTITTTLQLPVDDRLQRQRHLDASLLGASKHWSRRDFSPLHAAEWSRTLGALTDVEVFSAVYRVTRESHLFEPHGRSWQRAVRALRRLRRMTIGPGTRAVPTGRLWRYHVAFEVPIAWWERFKPHEAALWQALLEHYRATRDALASAEGAASWETAYAAASQREAALIARMQASDEALEGELTLALAHAWRNFLAAVEIAGTLELPAWRYRMSSKYDTAQAAKAQIGEQLHRDEEETAGKKDALAAIARGHDLGSWARITVAQTYGRLTADLQPILGDLQSIVDQCAVLEQDDPTTGLPVFSQHGNAIAGTIHDVTARIDLLTRTWSPQSMANHRGGFRALAAEIPLLISPSIDSERPSAATTPPRRVSVPLRSWISHTVLRDVAMALVAAEQDIETHTHQVGMSLHHAREVLDYHLTSAAASRTSVDRGLGERLATMLRSGRDALVDLHTRVGKSLEERAEQALTKGAAPLVAGHWEEIQRGVRRLEGRDRPHDRVRRWFRDRRVAALARTRARGRQIAEEIAAVFDERSTPAESEAFRRMVLGPRSAMPEVYQRLFTSVPAETIGLIVERKEATLLRQAVDRWQIQRAGAILLRGDRGIGKRTLVRQLLVERSETLQPRWVRLSPTLESESDVCRVIAEAAQWPVVARFDTLAVSVRRRMSIVRPARPTVLIIENAERLFRRNGNGLARLRAFLDLVAATSSEVLWLVLMAEPAVHALRAPLEFESRFAHIIRVAPLGAAELTQVVQARHRLSGYGLKFVSHSPSIQEWLRHPAQAWKMLQRGHHGVYERLWRISGGNVRQALQLWLTITHPDPSDASRIIVEPLTAVRSPLLEGIPLHARFILRTLLMLGPLEIHDLAQEELERSVDLEADLARLSHLGLIRSEPLHTESGPRSRLVSLELRAIAPLTEELRQCNLL